MSQEMGRSARKKSSAERPPRSRPAEASPRRAATERLEGPPRRSRLRTVMWWCGGVAGGAILLGAALISLQPRNGQAESPVSSYRLEQIPFDGADAYENLKRLCEIGPRPSGSPGMKAQQELLLRHFAELGAEVELQQFAGRDPRSGAAVPMANVIARFFPERPERILLCAHYDTLPLPMRDPVNPRGRFVGANDGASGTAVLMTMARYSAEFPRRFGVDLVLFDGEEFLFEEWQPFFQGSEHFAREYARSAKERPWRYRAAVLLDMIGDADLQIYQERNSAWWRDTRWIVEGIWATAARLRVREFIPRKKHEMRDDHIPLHNIGGIPAIVLIDFDYPYWHTRQDVPEKCSALSLAKVGWVVLEWMKGLD
ncbi:MAG: M28 family peptidase, partial [Thermogutta sp.]|nr:M28 family peptidase [Thermogutta sp.]